MRYALNFDDLFDNFENQTDVSSDMLLSGNLSTPLPPGSQETVAVQLPAGAWTANTQTAVLLHLQTKRPPEIAPCILLFSR